MKQIHLIGVALLAAITLTFTGCVSQTPAHAVVSAAADGTLTTNTAPASYAVSPGLTNAAEKIQSAIATVGPAVTTFLPPAAPFVPLASGATNAILSLLTMASAALAAWKNKQAQSQSAAAAALAAAIPAISHPQALALASQNGSTAAVAVHLANSQAAV